VGYNSHIFRGIYWGGGLRNFVYTTRPLFARVGYNSHIFKDIYWDGGLGNLVYTRPLFNKKLGWDITVIYLRTFIGVGDWEI